MARRPSPTQQQRRLFASLTAKLEPSLRDAFNAAAQDLKDGVAFADLVRALADGNVEAAIAALNIEPASFYAYGTAKTQAYAQGGAMAATTINAPAGGNIVFRFDMANPRAEAWIAENVGQKITGELLPETIDAVRQTIASGYAKGAHPHTIATDIAGRVFGGQRTGGILGLDGPRADRLRIVTEGMRTAGGVQDLVIMGRDGVPRVRYKVNAATEKAILRAYAAGGAVPEAQQIKAAQQYSNKLLSERAQMVARTETGQAVMSARAEEWRQAAEKLGYPPEAISKTWRHGSGSPEARPDHEAMNGKTVQGLNTPFVFPDGAAKQHALDGVGGAKHDAACGCGTDFRLDHTLGLT